MFRPVSRCKVSEKSLNMQVFWHIYVDKYRLFIGTITLCVGKKRVFFGDFRG